MYAGEMSAGGGEMIAADFCKKYNGPCRMVMGCEFLPDGNCGHMIKGQESMTGKAQPLLVPKNRFMEILNPIGDLLLRKNQNYGNSYHKLREKYGEVSFLIRLSDKFNRLEQLILNGEPDKVAESVEDTIKDIIGYSTLELDFRRGQENENAR